MDFLRKHPVLISGIGFFICLVSFITAAVFQQSTFTTYLFFIGFAVGAIGVFIGFFAYKQDD